MVKIIRREEKNQKIPFSNVDIGDIFESLDTSSLYMRYSYINGNNAVCISNGMHIKFQLDTLVLVKKVEIKILD